MDQLNKERLLEDGVINDKTVTYVFGKQDQTMQEKVALRWKTRIWQVFPSICASMMCIPFGLMLGWPSPSYPYLLTASSEIPITKDQSAMIAGFLMIGNTVATPLSTKSVFGAKYGMVLGVSLMTCSWIIMWQAVDLYWLLGSRLIGGLGHGYSMGQLKNYIQEMCETDLSLKLIKQINFYNFLGVIISFSVGPFVTFRYLSMICIIITAVVLFLIIFLPSTPRELIKSDNIKDAKRLLLFLKPDANLDEEIRKIIQALNETSKSMGFSGIIKEAGLRKNFMIFVVLVFCQQFSGLPSTLIYCQILFEESHCPNSIYIAIVYSMLFFMSNIIGVYVTPKYNKRNVLLASSFFVSLTTAVKIAVIYFQVNEKYFPYASVVVMYIYVVVNTIGLGNIPFTMINDLFPKNCKTFVVLFFVMFYSMLALIVTKIFQSLFTLFDMYVPFCLFCSVSLFCFLFVLIFVPNKFEPVMSANIPSNKIPL